MAEIRMVEDGKVVEPSAPQVISNTPTTSVSPDGFIDKMAAAQVLGLENESDRQKYSDELDTIIKWAKMEGYNNPTELKWMIKLQQDRMGTPPLTEKWIQRFHVFAGLKLQEQRIKQQEASLLKGFDSASNEW